MKILVIEDDPTLSRNIVEAFAAEGWTGEPLYDGAVALRMLRKAAFDCVVMDVNLPGLNGLELCARFRESNKVTPVLMLTAFGDLEDKVRGYDSGADDYLTKPFYMRELVLRINSLLKRAGERAADTGVLTAGDIVINTRTMHVSRAGKSIELTPREYSVLLKLVRKKGEVVTRTELMSDVWGKQSDGNSNTLEVYVNFLRNKIDKPFGKQSIRTRVGFGYYLEEE